jgi:hypothetical protein
MADIFGYELHDYQHLTKIKQAGVLDSHMAQLNNRGRIHDFNVLRSRSMPIRDAETTAQALSFITNNFQAIQAQIEEILYLDFRLDEFIPIITNVPEGARSYSYRVIDKYGRGKFIDNAGKTADTATVSMQNVPYNLSYGGILPTWTLEDLRAAAFGGVALDTETIKAGMKGCMDHIELVGLVGDPALGYLGLTNNTNIAIGTAAVAGHIHDMDADEMVKFVQALAISLVSNSKEIFGRVVNQGATLYLPVEQAGYILDTKLAVDASKSVWQYVSTNNLFTHYTNKPLELKIVQELKGAGVGTVDRCLFGLNNERVMEMAMPIAPRAINTIQIAYGVEVPLEYKISGLNIKRPAGLLYIDGI